MSESTKPVEQNLETEDLELTDIAQELTEEEMEKVEGGGPAQRFDNTGSTPPSQRRYT